MKYPIGFAILYGVMWNLFRLMFLRSLWDSAGNILHLIYLHFFAFDEENEPQFVSLFYYYFLKPSCDFQLCKKYFGTSEKFKIIYFKKVWKHIFFLT